MLRILQKANFVKAVACSIVSPTLSIASQSVLKDAGTRLQPITPSLQRLTHQDEAGISRYPELPLRSQFSTAGVHGVSQEVFGRQIKRLKLSADQRTEGTAVGEYSAGSQAKSEQQGTSNPNEGERGAKRIGMPDAEASVQQKSDRKIEAQDHNNVEYSRSLPEVLVEGGRILNIDIPRSEDDAQPYVVFDREEIERSGAASLEEFFRGQLTMSVNAISGGQDLTKARSTINLRGLGTDETLILIDGRRVAQHIDTSFPQADITGIPLAAIERIEVLPTTASGIYGGGATGGVINIVLRRDYSGVEAKLTYGNSFESDVASRRLDVSAGFNVESGRTTILLAGSYYDANPLLSQERAFVQRGRQHILEHNPAFFFNSPRPPLGATTNIRSNTFLDGVRQNLVLDSGIPLGSAITYVPNGYPGVMFDGGEALIANAGSYNLEPPQTAQLHGGYDSLLSEPQLTFWMATIRRELNSRIQAYLDLQDSRNLSEFSSSGALGSSSPDVVIPGDAPNNPFQQDIQVSVPALGVDGLYKRRFTSRRARAGLLMRLPGSWQSAIDFSWDRAKYSSIGPSGVTSDTRQAIQAGTIDVLRDINLFPVTFETYGLPASAIPSGQTTMRNIGVRAAGPLPWSLPGGRIRVTTLVERREEIVGEQVNLNLTATGVPVEILRPGRSQDINSVYLELTAPIVAPSSKVSGIEQLELQIAVRRDEYSVVGASDFINLAEPQPVNQVKNRKSSIDPTVAIRYQPLPDITLRASYGTGYLPPSVLQLVPNPPVQLDLSTLLSDPLRGNQPLGVVTVHTGGNPDLMPEESKTWSAGMILTPQWVTGLRVSIDWSRIVKNNNIVDSFLFRSQSDFNSAINILPHRIIREFSPDGSSVGPIIALDDTAINLAKHEVQALDIALNYNLNTSNLGDFDISLNATHLLSSKTKTAPTAEYVENAGVFSSGNSPGGVKWNAHIALNWQYNAWSFGWRTRYIDSYYLNASRTAVASQGAASIPSQTYHDFYGSYAFAELAESGMSILANTEIFFGVNNVFNRFPPIDVVLGRNYYSAYGDPRLAHYYFSIRKRF